MYGTDFTRSGTLYREITSIERGAYGQPFDVVSDCIYQGDLWRTVPGGSPRKIGT